MNKLLKYELRRMIWNQFFFSIMGIIIVYGYMLLSGTIILGVSNTAPFSTWSIGYYIGMMMPILCFSELLSIAMFFSKKEQAVRTIIGLTPFPKSTYLFVRSIAILLVMLIIIVIILIMGFIFDGYLFKVYPVRSYMIPVVVTIIPITVFFLGLGMFCGSRNLLLLMIPVIIMILGLTPFVDLYQMKFYQQYPKSLAILDPSFKLPLGLLVKQIALLGIGIVFWVLEWRKRKEI